MPKRIPGRHFARNLITRRTLIFQLVKRDFQQRYVGSAAGWLWGLIHPLVLLGSYTFIFSYCLKTPPPAGVRNYPLSLFAGMLPWLLFSETVQRSSGSIVEQANLVTKTMFPSEIVPVSIFLSSLVSHLMTVALFAAVAGIYLGHVSPMLLLLPVFTLLLGLFAVGIGWVTSSLQVYLRDTAQVVAVIMTFWLWLSPIFISEDKFPAGVRFILRVNPIAYVVRAYRQMLLGTDAPALRDLVVVGSFAIGAFILGGLFFRHMKRGFADVL
ncbi:MAG: ABC transporter permease [Acidobacteriota bacterium]|nr:ABC transporter permease [Acidobacteriota bacterium]